MGGGWFLPPKPSNGVGIGGGGKIYLPFLYIDPLPSPFFYLCLSLYLYLCLVLSLSLYFCLIISLSFCLSLSLSLSVCLFLCLCLFYLSFYLYLSLYSIINKKIILLFILQVCFYSLHIQIFYMNESSRPSF